MSDDLFEWAREQDDGTAAADERRDQIARDFEEWKQSLGARHVLRDMHAKAAGFFRDYQRFGIRVSMKYLWEIERHHLGKVRARLKRMGGDLEKWHGYRLNNNFTALIARHILDRHPEWDGLFEIRERRAA